MKKKKIIWTTVIMLAIAGVLFGFSEYNRKVKGLNKVKADYTLQASSLISRFESNEANANTQYLGKIIEVRGNLKAIEKAAEGNYTLVLGQPDNLSAVRCSMDADQADLVKSISENTVVTVKGACTGFNQDDLLGSDVVLNRAVIVSE